MSPDTPDVTPHQALPDVIAPAHDAANDAVPTVKRPRAPRKTALKAAAEVVDVPVSPPAAADDADAASDAAAAATPPEAATVPRKRTRKPAELAPTIVGSASTEQGNAASMQASALAPPTTLPAVSSLDAGAGHAFEDAVSGPAAGAGEVALVAGENADDGATAEGATAEAASVEGATAEGEGRRSRSRRRRRGRRGNADEVSGEGAADGLADGFANDAQADAGADGDDLPGGVSAAGEAQSADGAAAVDGAADGAARLARAERPVRPQRPERAPRPIGPAVEFATADVSDTFAGVLSGDFDIDADGVEGVSPVPAKRVLAAEPDAPKLHKVLAQSGIGSRRDMEQLITDGKVTVNGEVAHTGQRISFGDEVRVAGRVVKLRIAPPSARVIAYHKPAGEVVTMDDPQQRPTVFRRLPRLQHGKWQSVGRLDINTEGLLLFTNSGDLANKLMHPRFGVEREYAVRVLGTLDLESREKLLSGVTIDGQAAQFKSIEDGGGEGANRWYRVVITEGRNREVRKLFDAIGMAVSRLIRIRYGSVVLPKGLRRAVWVDLDDADVRRLRQLAGADSTQRGGAPRDDGPRENGQRDAAPRENGQRDGAPRGNGPRDLAPRDGAPRGDRGPRPDNGARPNGGATAKPRDRNDRNDRNARGRERGERRPEAQASSPAPFREPGDPSFIPNPLQQTFDRRAIQQRERPVIVDYDDETDGPIGPIPNPLQQTYDKRGVQGNRNAFGGGGRGGKGGGGAGGGGKQGGGAPKQPDPLQTAVGYIGADTFIKKLNNRGGGGGRGRR